MLETGGIGAQHPSLAAWQQLPLPVVVDQAGELTRAAKIRNRPVALLLDREGVVRMKGVVSTGRHLDALVQGWGVAAGDRQWKAVEAA